MNNILELPYTEIINEVCAYLTLTTTPYKMKKYNKTCNIHER